MPLEYQRDSIDDLDDSTKPLYVERDGKYVLDIDGLPKPEDTTSLKNALEHLRREKRELAEQAKAAAEAAEAAAAEAARKQGDTKALEESWQKKLSKRESELQAQLAELHEAVTSLTSGQEAVRLAAELAIPGSAEVLLPHIQRRLKTEYTDEGPKIVVLDKDGRPSAASPEELKQEFLENKAFAPLISGSKASGGGADGTRDGGTGPRAIKRSAWDAMSDVDRAAHARAGGTVID